jgi:hypothetical protein
MVFPLRSASTLPVPIIHQVKPGLTAVTIYSAAEPRHDGRQEARVFALAIGVLFSFIFALYAMTF